MPFLEKENITHKHPPPHLRDPPNTQLATEKGTPKFRDPKKRSPQNIFFGGGGGGGGAYHDIYFM